MDDICSLSLPFSSIDNGERERGGGREGGEGRGRWEIYIYNYIEMISIASLMFLCVPSKSHLFARMTCSFSTFCRNCELSGHDISCIYTICYFIDNNFVLCCCFIIFP